MRIAALLLILALMVGSAGWIGRGLYDREFMLEGRFMLVNATPARTGNPSCLSFRGLAPEQNSQWPLPYLPGEENRGGRRVCVPGRH